MRAHLEVELVAEKVDLQDIVHELDVLAAQCAILAFGQEWYRELVFVAVPLVDTLLVLHNIPPLQAP